jgi:hypothetical protein
MGIQQMKRPVLGDQPGHEPDGNKHRKNQNGEGNQPPVARGPEMEEIER